MAVIRLKATLIYQNMRGFLQVMPVKTHQGDCSCCDTCVGRDTFSLNLYTLSCSRCKEMCVVSVVAETSTFADTFT